MSEDRATRLARPLSVATYSHDLAPEELDEHPAYACARD